MRLAVNGDATWGEACRAAWQHVNSGMMTFWSLGQICLFGPNTWVPAKAVVHLLPRDTQQGVHCSHQLLMVPASNAAESAMLTGHWRTLLPVQRLPAR